MPDRGVLALRVDDDPNIVIAERDGGVPDVFWGQLRIEWGYAGDPARKVRVPIGRFRGNLGWLRAAAARYGVSISWTNEVLSIIATMKEERQALDAARREPNPVAPGQVEQLLVGTRFVRPLKEFQLRDAGKLLGLPHGANFSVPGAGKTSVAYAVYEALRRSQSVEQLLVVAPLSAFDAWQTEATDCFAEGERPAVATVTEDVPAGAEVLLVNYHRLASNLEKLGAWVRSKRTLVLLDEAHRMKAGRAGQHGSACLDLAFAAARRDILSGTPSPQSAQDFVALYDYLWPGQARRILPPDALGARPSADSMHRVSGAIAPLFVRTTKGELDLPPTRRIPVVVALEGLQREIYVALRDRYVGSLHVSMNDRAELARMGTVVMYLLEAATNPQLLAVGSKNLPGEFSYPPLPVEPGTRLWDLIAGYGRHEIPPKLTRLRQIIEQNARAANGSRKTLVWSNFVANLEGMRRWLSVFQPAMIHGGVPTVTAGPTAAVTREDELRRFREDPECLVMLANPAAMSEGVSLHKVCHHAVYVDRTFNAGQFLQSVDRIHRLGLDPDVQTTLMFLITANTIDRVVDSRLHIKAEAMGIALNDPDLVTMALPDEEDYGAPVENAEDMAALLAHLRGETR
jgi:SNF2 family DNA or RNA helicase